VRAGLEDVAVRGVKLRKEPRVVEATLMVRPCGLPRGLPDERAVDAIGRPVVRRPGGLGRGCGNRHRVSPGALGQSARWPIMT
jgi:hypothetical protein